MGGQTRLAYIDVQESRTLPILTQGTTSVGAALGVQATNTLAALGSGKRYIATGATFSLGTLLTLAVSTVGVAIIDGASGAATYLWRGIMQVGTTGAEPITLSDLWLIGSDNTALTIEFSAGVTSAGEMVAIQYSKTGAATTT